MTKESFEHLSSLMDGELTRETGLFMARRLSSDKELGAAWKRYHLIRDCIRQPGNNGAMFDLSERIAQQLDGESIQPGARTAKRWLRSLSGLAVAASVAVVAIMLVAPHPVQDGPDDAEPVAGSFTSPNTLPAVARSQPASYSPGQRETERRLNSYLLRHNQLASATGSQGFVSFVPIISSRVQEETEVDQSERAEDAAFTTDPESNARQ